MFYSGSEVNATTSRVNTSLGRLQKFVEGLWDFVRLKLHSVVDDKAGTEFLQRGQAIALNRSDKPVQRFR